MDILPCLRAQSKIIQRKTHAGGINACDRSRDLHQALHDRNCGQTENNGQNRQEKVGERGTKIPNSCKSYPRRDSHPGKSSLARRAVTHVAKRRSTRGKAGRSSLEIAERWSRNSRVGGWPWATPRETRICGVTSIRGLMSSASPQMFLVREPRDLDGGSDDVV